MELLDNNNNKNINFTLKHNTTQNKVDATIVLENLDESENINDYKIQIIAPDNVGNHQPPPGYFETSFTVDKTPPTIENSPTANVKSYIFPPDNQDKLIGFIIEDALSGVESASYQLSDGKKIVKSGNVITGNGVDDDTTTDLIINEITKESDNEFTLTFDVKQYNIGGNVYTLTLRASDKSRITTTESVQFVTDNEPPTLTFAAAAPFHFKQGAGGSLSFTIEDDISGVLSASLI